MSCKPASVRIAEDSAARDGGNCRRNIAGEWAGEGDGAVGV